MIEFPTLLLRHLLTSASNPAQLEFSEVLGRLADFKDQSYSRRSFGESVLDTSSDANNDGNRDTYEDPPETTQFSIRRTCVALSIQIISRFLVIFQSEPTDDISIENSSMHAKIPRSTLVYQRLDICKRLEIFMRLGGDSLFMLALLKDSQNVTVTLSDKQFIVWTLREAAVASMTVQGVETATNILRWFAWILGCSHPSRALSVDGIESVKQSSDSNGVTLKRDLDKSNAGLTKSPPLVELRSKVEEREEKKNNIISQSIILSPLPSSKPALHPALRLLVLQELRMIIGGDMCAPVLQGKNTFLGSRILSLPMVTGGIYQNSSAYGSSSRESSPRISKFNSITKDKDGDLSSVKSGSGRKKSAPDNEFSTAPQTLSFHVPLSSAASKSYFIRAGLVELLVELCFGDACKPALKSFLFHTTSTNDKSKSNNSFSKLDAEEWWGAFTALAQLIVGSDEAKDALSRPIDVYVIIRALLPIAKSSTSPAALTLFMLDLCVCRGSVVATGRPYFACGKLPPFSNNMHSPHGFSTGSLFGQGDDSDTLISSASAECFIKPCLIDTLGPLICDSYEVQETLLAALSPVYYLRGRMGYFVTSCTNPTLLHDYWRLRPLKSRGSDKGSHSKIPTADVTGMHASELRQQCGEHYDCSCRDDNIEETGSQPAASESSNVLACSTPMRHDAYHQHRQLDSGDMSQPDFIRNTQPQPQASTGVDSQDDSSLANNPTHGLFYSPIFPALGWALSSKYSLILSSISELLRSRGSGMKVFEQLTGKSEQSNSNSKNVGGSFRSGPGSYLSTFIPPGGPAEGRIIWQPPFSRIQIRANESVDILVAMSMLLTGHAQRIVLSSLSHLLEGNPANAAMLLRCGVDRSLTKLLFIIDEKQRNAFSHILSQILRYDIDGITAHMLVHGARHINGVYEDAVDVIQAVNIPVTGISVRKPVLSKSIYNPVPNASTGTPGLQSQRHVSGIDSSSYAMDYVGRLMLFILGRTAEREAPESFFHFAHGDPFRDIMLLPPIERVPPAKIGITVNMWLRLGTFADVPFSTLFQLSNRNNNTVITSEKIAIDVYFRVILRIPATGADDIKSVTSGVTSMPGDFGQSDEICKKVLQLCISHRNLSNVSVRPENEDNRLTDRQNDILFIAPWVAFTVPDAVVEFDWSELGDWHLLSLSFGGDGFRCWVDGIPRVVHHWSPLGYREDSWLSSGGSGKEGINSAYIPATKDIPLIISLGGMSVGEELVSIATDRLVTLEKKCREENKDNNARDVQLQNELILLQTFYALIKGFSGAIGEMIVIEGVPDCLQLQMCVAAGARKGISCLTGNKTIIKISPSEIPLDPVSAATSNHRPSSTSSSSLHLERGRTSVIVSHLVDDERLQYGYKIKRRLSRSLSPNTVGGRSESANATSPVPSAGLENKTTVPPNSPAGAVTARSRNVAESKATVGVQGGSLVSDILTMFAGTSKEDGSAKSGADERLALYGVVQVHHTKLISDKDVLSKVGGLKIWYPLLVMDRCATLGYRISVLQYCLSLQCVYIIMAFYYF